MAATIVSPTEYVGAVMELCQDRRGEMQEHSVMGANRTLLKWVLGVAYSAKQLQCLCLRKDVLVQHRAY